MHLSQALDIFVSQKAINTPRLVYIYECFCSKNRFVLPKFCKKFGNFHAFSARLSSDILTMMKIPVLRCSEYSVLDDIYLDIGTYRTTSSDSRLIAAFIQSPVMRSRDLVKAGIPRIELSLCPVRGTDSEARSRDLLPEGLPA